MEEVRYRSAGQWLEAIRSRQGHELQASSDPVRRIIGFIDHTDETYHLIGLSDLKGTRHEMGDAQDLVLTYEGRQRLVEG